MDKLVERVEFYQVGPRLGNPLLEDVSLQRYLEQSLLKGCPKKDSIIADLTAFGDQTSEFLKMSENAERFKPQLEQFDQWGRRVDRLHVSEGWKYFKRQSAKDGLIAIPYETKNPTEYDRIHQAVKLLLFAANSGMFSCPLAMTDGAAFVLRDLLAEKNKEKFKNLPIGKLQRAYERLTTRNPDEFITSGQWFTEKAGGSDLARTTETYAVKSGDHYRLYGYKWFTSSVDSEMTLTLASIAPESGPLSLHSERKPLSFFFMETRSDEVDQSKFDHEVYNNLHMVRLKDKCGTRQLPTAEIVLRGAKAFLLSEPGAGVRAASPMLTITRFHNAIASVAYQLRMRNAALDFANSRTAFGTKIVEKPLHLQSLVEYDYDARGNLLIVLEMARLLGRMETDTATTAEENLLRVFSPLAKAFTAKETTRMMSEGVELFGAVGIMENHLSTLFRDSTVLPIWEGTTNVLSLDVLRVASREPEAIVAFKSFLVELSHGNAELLDNIAKVFGFIASSSKDLDLLEWNAKRLLMNLSRLLVAALSINMYHQTQDQDDFFLTEHWINRVTTQFEPFTPINLNRSKHLPKTMNGSDVDARGKLRSSI